ncbi:MAG: hypothetical protein IIZ25_04340 [Thermoguttaceae bacterium]|nr:hypothetical protein [Thermoguttaceae bacterium]
MRNWILPFVFALALLGGAAALHATDYFVDSREGNDSSDGRSADAAWRTIAQVNASSFQPGDRVLFKRGCLWRENLILQSGEEQRPLLYGAYGEGEKPLLLGSTPLNRESDWVKESDSIWVTRPPVIQTAREDQPMEFLSGGWSLHTENGASVGRRIDGSGTDARIHLDCHTAGTASNHIQLINGAFPVREGECCRVRFTASATKPVEPKILLMRSGPPWTGYGTILGGGAELGPEEKEHSFILKVTKTADDARLTFYFGGLVPEETQIDIGSFSVELLDAIPFINDVGNIILDGNRAGVKKWCREDLKQQDDFWYDILGDGRLRFYSDINPAKKYRSIEAANREHIIIQYGVHDVIVEDLDLRCGAAHGFGGGGVARMTIRRCDISWIGGGDQNQTGGEGRRVRFGNGIEFWCSAVDCLVEDCRLWEIYDAALSNQGNGTNTQKNITYRNNDIWNSEYSFEYWNRDETSVTENIVFEGNRCYNAGFGWGHSQRPDPNGRHLMFYSNTAKTAGVLIRGNLFCEAIDSLIRLTPTKTNPDWQTTALRFESNLFYNSEKDAAWWLDEKIGASDYSRFLRLLGPDNNNIWQKPETIPPVPESALVPSY